MPKQKISVSDQVRAHRWNTSITPIVAGFLQSAGWEIYFPADNHGCETNIAVSDGQSFYRIVTRQFNDINESTGVEKQWLGTKADFLVICSLSDGWGIIMPRFEEEFREFDHPGNIHFDLDRDCVIEAFEELAPGGQA
jgi:hypothetical protein